ncbi:SGNH/GDSL hydrolase family protein [Asticcacaulis endophyticus]|uniref:SGNH hydrolase-type esterase domain-containing protein n=1 Tax=Asticcacaulis endophyticus TaxID=1395890 RepID=A0A918QAE4_9CAUL|nr:GDSL-type esterase/lipase family protein [Asticcacaulis endophyticus]GGZ39238.1 hypothetical protein GCM10011273_27080 [Asticcacaulis endophyticus]
MITYNKAATATMAAVIVLSAGAAGATAWKFATDNAKANQPVDHFRQRVNAINSQADQMQAETIIIGDSLTEFARIDSLCGGAVLNAGISSASIQDTSRWAGELIERSKAKRVIFAIGSNNAKNHLAARPVDEAMKTYRQIITNAKGRDIAIATLPAISETREGFKASYIDDLNAGIRTLAAEVGVPVVELDQDLPTIDGIHLTADAYKIWRAQMGTVCKV